MHTVETKLQILICHVPEVEHGTGDGSIEIVEKIVTDCSPFPANFDLQTSFPRNLAPGQSDVCNKTNS